MKKSSSHIILFVVVTLLTGCGDIVETNYSTKSKAQDDNLFQRGWLPSFIPESSRSLIVKNDLDSNSSSGEFYFSTKELKSFLKYLKEMDADLSFNKAFLKAYEKQGYSPYRYVNSDSSWIFLIDKKNGHSVYYMKCNQ
ncbi:MAG: hypothetical protein AAGA64_18415 [Bacteroidota bacterium]